MSNSDGTFGIQCPLLVTQMERNLSVHTVFFFCPQEETLSKNNSGQTRVVCCKTGKCLQAQLEIPVSSKDYVSFPFQTLAPGLWLLLLKRMPEPRSPLLHAVGRAELQRNGHRLIGVHSSSSSPGV